MRLKIDHISLLLSRDCPMYCLWPRSGLEGQVETAGGCSRGWGRVRSRRIVLPRLPLGATRPVQLRQFACAVPYSCRRLYHRRLSATVSRTSAIGCGPPYGISRLPGANAYINTTDPCPSSP